MANSNKNRKRPTSKKNTKSKKNGDLDKKIYLGLLCFNTFLLIFSFFSGTGLLGEFIKTFFFKYFGITFYPFFIVLEIFFIFILLNKVKNENRYRFSLIFFLLFNSMGIVDLSSNNNGILALKFEVAKSLAKNGEGSGLLGALIGYFYSLTIGIVGLYIVTFLFGMFLILSFLDISFMEFMRICKDFISNVFKNSKEKYGEYKETREEIKREKQIEIDENEEFKNSKSENENFNFEPTVDYDSIEIFGNDVKEEIYNDENEKSDNNLFDSYDLFPENDESNNDLKDIKTENEYLEEIQNSTENTVKNLEKEDKPYVLPPLSLLKDETIKSSESDKVLRERAKKIEQTLKSFGVDAKIIQINKGPTVTCFELQPAPGVKVNKIVNLADDLSLALASHDIRIEAPIPGKSAIGIEVANNVKENVLLKEILTSDEYIKNESKMPMALGKTIIGDSIVSSMDKMPHILIAGATGSGKSVCVNTIILSILYKSKPDEVKLILIDPKVVELSIYNGIPHLAIPVVTEPKKASAALNWAVREMERRYTLFSDNQVRDIKGYNEKQKIKDLEKLPYLVIVIDELSDLMMVSANEVESHITRLAQMARACGIHLIVATQRPSVDVITGTIKANIPSRISFQVSSQIDSRTILDSSGAETLLGRGDMLFSPSGSSKPTRIQGCFVSDSEVENVVNFVKNQFNEVEYDKEIITNIENETVYSENDDDEVDDLFYEAVKIILEEDSASISLLQRKMKIGYARAGRIIDEMESRQIVGKQEGSKPRKILIGFDYLDNLKGGN